MAHWPVRLNSFGCPVQGLFVSVDQWRTGQCAFPTAQLGACFGSVSVDQWRTGQCAGFFASLMTGVASVSRSMAHWPVRPRLRAARDNTVQVSVDQWRTGQCAVSVDRSVPEGITCQSINGALASAPLWLPASRKACTGCQSINGALASAPE